MDFGTAWLPQITLRRDIYSDQRICRWHVHRLAILASVNLKIRQSSETTRRGKITKQGRKRLRTICIRAVLSMVNRTKTPLMEFYQQKKREKGAGKAIVATARKLLVIVYVMLKKGLDYWYIEDRLYNQKLSALGAAA